MKQFVAADVEPLRSQHLVLLFSQKVVARIAVSLDPTPRPRVTERGWDWAKRNAERQITLLHD